MKDPVIRNVIFHGPYADKYIPEIKIGADSLFTLVQILFIEVFPNLRDEPSLQIVIENSLGEKTEIFDPNQELLDNQGTIHIIPNPDGSELLTAIITAIITVIISVGISLLLAPKIDDQSTTVSGANFEGKENVIGQGGVIPVALGTRVHGSRVVSHGIDAGFYIGSNRSN